MSNKASIFILIAICIFSVQAFSQSTKLIIRIDGKEIPISAFVKNEFVYASSSELAEALKIKYYKNKANQKIEYKFDAFNLKFSSKNPFVIKSAKSAAAEQIIQLPISTYFIDDQIFVPLEYVLELTKNAYPNQMDYDKDQQVLSVLKGTPILKEIISPKEGTISIAEKTNGVLITIKCVKKIPKYSSFVKKDVLTLTLNDINVPADNSVIIPSKNFIKRVSSKKIKSNSVISFDLKPGYSSHEFTSKDDGKTLLLTIRKASQLDNSAKKDKWDFNVIVIDAGHGGKDHGAIGLNGLKEKDVNLAIALKTGKLIEDNIKGVKVVYTRKTDKFVELYKRGKIANEKNGKLFISIHCNSTPQKPTDASGTEIYLLRPGKTESAIKIAEEENSVIKYEDNPSRYQKITGDNFILVSMAHSSYMKYSEKFSDYLNTNFINNQQLKSRGVKQAGFYVLVGASMPGVLVETGFISNKNDAQMLKSSAGQTKVATSIYEAIKKFKDYYEKVIKTES
jgi:N-acetylmuramoyl-L-alanine amidase